MVRRVRMTYSLKMRMRTRLMLMIERLLLSPLREITWRTSADPATPVALLRRMAAQDAAEFISQHTASALLFTHRFQLMDYALTLIPAQGLLLEFGVFRGESLDYFASKIPNRTFFGFDSFTGLQENWGGSDKPKSSFNQSGRLPKVPKNCALVKGWFNETLPGWVREHAGSVAFLHIDSDTFQACQTVLEQLRDRITPETIILFDEHHGYPGWRNGEFRALHEFLARHRKQATYLAFSDAGAVVRVAPA